MHWDTARTSHGCPLSQIIIPIHHPRASLSQSIIPELLYPNSSSQSSFIPVHHPRAPLFQSLIPELLYSSPSSHSIIPELPYSSPPSQSIIPGLSRRSLQAGPLRVALLVSPEHKPRCFPRWHFCRTGPLCPVQSRGQCGEVTALSLSRQALSPPPPGAVPSPAGRALSPPRPGAVPRDPLVPPALCERAGRAPRSRLPMASANQKISLALPANQRLSLGRLEAGAGSYTWCGSCQPVTGEGGGD